MVTKSHDFPWGCVRPRWIRGSQEPLTLMSSIMIRWAVESMEDSSPTCSDQLKHVWIVMSWWLSFSHDLWKLGNFQVLIEIKASHVLWMWTVVCCSRSVLIELITLPLYSYLLFFCKLLALILVFRWRLEHRVQIIDLWSDLKLRKMLAQIVCLRSIDSCSFFRVIDGTKWFGELL